EAAKARAKELLDRFRREGAVPEDAPTARDGDVAIHSELAASDLPAALAALLDGARPPAYVAVLAWLPPFPELAAALGRLRETIANRTGVAATAAFGPRYLHSTGQLHKGDAGRGRFLVLTSESPDDVPIPDAADADGSSLGFRALERAQALGDVRALAEKGRRVVRLHLDSADPAALDRLAGAIPASRRLQ
ncbi:MAG TPA: glucose-6-phosphate isomerase, partial [Gemmatimonadota bacterium]|nr:glucose-6-phosphate isomerase [Gemmatimonadota bacterium]